jgi:predicted SAM-dependent methyltransferase
MKRLHIGCGHNYLPGWVNVDLFSSVNADIYADITALPFDRGTFDLIYASHVLEHCHRNAIFATLSHWRDLLKDGGVLRLAVPNFNAIVEHYNKHKNLELIMGLLYGRQDHPRNNHFVTFDEAYLIRCLGRAWFKKVQRWDWRITEHSEFDDYSQCYLPHMDKENGMLMSLNLEATK